MGNIYGILLSFLTRGVVIVKRLNEQLVGHVGDVVDRECTSRPLNIFSSKDSY